MIRFDDELPHDFVCVICRQATRPSRWQWMTAQQRPPICRSCGIRGGHQLRIAGMTRGDHRELQRLVAITNALRAEAGWIEWSRRDVVI